MRHLATVFDVVGVTECFDSFLDEIEARLPLTPIDTPQLRQRRRQPPNTTKIGVISAGSAGAAGSSSAAAAHAASGDTMRVQPMGTSLPGSALHAAAHAWTWAALNSSEKARVRAVAACDLPLYRYAESQARRRAATATATPSACPASSCPSCHARDLRLTD